jgi:FAD/FMN-containing dehydrogenase
MNGKNQQAAAALQRACAGLKVVTEPSVLESHGRDWTRFRAPRPAAVAFPESVSQVQQLVAAAAAAEIALVPSGGRTGLSGGAVAADGEVVVSFDRMRRVLDFNRVDRTLTVEAGVITATVQERAAAEGLYYPVSFAAEGSSQIGGNIATNAGGIRVLRYGLTRDQVAGLKVVTGRGEVLECNRGLIKNASGYDLRHLFTGSEGTLGLIVEATLRLTDPPPPSKVLLLGVDSMDALMKVFATLRARLDLSAFEFFTDRALHHVRVGQGLPPPLDASCPLYVIVEREGISESISHFPPYKNDLSVTVSRVPEFLRRMDRLIGEICPEFEVVWYGHIGDGNLHMNILKPADLGLETFESRCHEISERTYALTRDIGGSISAEHGIGLLKQPWLDRVRSAEEIGFMRGIKQVFDPAGIFNPGKLL